FMCLLERVRVICLCVELFINRISVFRFLLPFSTTLIYSLSLHDALPIYLLIKSPEVGRMVPADHPVNGQVFTKARPTGPADIRVTFTRWNDQYLSCQPVPDQLLPSLTAGIPFYTRVSATITCCKSTLKCDSQLHLAAFRSSGWRFQMPMTRVDRAASTTSSVMVCSSLIFMMRSIWVNSRSTSRKLPWVTRAIAASAWASVKSSGSRVCPSLCHRRSRTKRSSTSARGRYSWAKPTLL